MSLRKLMVPSLVLAMVSTLAGRAMADYISHVQSTAVKGNAVEINNVPQTPPFYLGNGQDPVVSYILSQPGTYGGHTYTSWSFLLNDGTGGMDVYGLSSTNSFGYAPTLGDGLDVKGTYSPYNQMPEVGTVTTINVTSTGNPLPANATSFGVNSPTGGSSTIGGLLYDLANYSQGSGTNQVLPNDVAMQLVELDNVNVSVPGGTFNATEAAGNQTGSISDGTGTLTMYYWTSSYAVPLINLGGYTPVGPQNVLGIIDNYNGTQPEFIPMAMEPASPVPEPGTLALLAQASPSRLQPSSAAGSASKAIGVKSIDYSADGRGA